VLCLSQTESRRKTSAGRIVAAGINPVDFKLRKGPFRDFVLPKPKVLGSYFAGIIVSVPEDSKFEVGQRVFGMLPILGCPFGSYASRCCVDENALAVAPKNVKLCHLAVMPLIACTVINGMKPVVEAYYGNVEGKKIFIPGGSGGVGSFAVQYCSNVLGMKVTTNCSAKNISLVQELGAEYAFDYHEKEIEDEIVNFDVFLDLFGYMNEKKVFCRGSKILKHDRKQPAHYIRVASSPYDRKDRYWMSEDPLGISIPEARIDRVVAGKLHACTTAWIHSIRYHFLFVVPDGKALQECAQAVSEGKVRAVIEKRFPLSQTSQAHALLESGHVTGKVVLVVNESVAGNEDSDIK
jgi:NADPH:quinone reductase-like Zn-dependent oxidoreductase